MTTETIEEKEVLTETTETKKKERDEKETTNEMKMWTCVTLPLINAIVILVLIDVIILNK